MVSGTLVKLIDYKTSLRWRIVTVLLVAALLPLALAGIGSRMVFEQLLENKALDHMRTIAQSHARAIDAHLAERANLLRLLAESQSLYDISNQERLSDLLADLNQITNGGFVDLGVIDAEGRHLAYTGPFDLLDRNYREADWFQEVISREVYISDVFLGFRQVPHCVIAVTVRSEGEQWVLRTTINSDQFDAIVGSVVLGENSGAYIINQDGQYQTIPEMESVVGNAPVPVVGFHRGVQDRQVEVNGAVKVEVTTWINDNRWLLVVYQDLAAVRAPAGKAIRQVANIVYIAVALLVVTTFIATWHLVRRIDKANAQREEMSRAFMRSAKLASIGELATGLAHEINNPLAVLSAEQTNISDVLADTGSGNQWRVEVLDSVERCQKQVRRCANITQKMLQFGRKRDSTLEPTDIAPRLTDITDLLQRHASVRNVKITIEAEDDLPQVMIDPVEFEQMLVNLVNNSIDALPEGGHIRIKARCEADHVHLEVHDDGVGMSREELDRIFEPFYTSKPPGKGTGLGLSVCYGIVHSWGGRIKADSELGNGTTMHIVLPLNRKQH